MNYENKEIELQRDQGHLFDNETGVCSRCKMTREIAAQANLKCANEQPGYIDMLEQP